MVRDRIRRLLSVGRTPGAFVPYRVTIGATVVISVLAVAMQQTVPIGLGLLAALLIPIGFLVSYRRRGRRNVLLKLILTAGLFIAFADFLGSVRWAQNIDDTRVPLAALFLWVQVLHSFDVPRRRDLAFSLASSVALMALAGSLSFSTGFLVFALPYALFFAAALATGHHAELDETRLGEPAEPAQTSKRDPGHRPLLRPVAMVMATTLLATSVVFVFLPRFPGMQLASLPVNLGNHRPISGFDGNVVNPGRDGEPAEGGTTGFPPDAYFGYGEELDLRTRGQLSHDLVLRVRSPEPSLLRGQVFDVYDGVRWTRSSTDFDQFQRSSDGVTPVPRPAEERVSGREVVQTFFVERPLPNLVFHAHRAKEVYAPATTLHADDANSLRMPFTLEEDTIYSVVSEVPNVDDADLRTLAPTMPETLDPSFDRYLELPETLEGRFTDLAHEITAEHTTVVDQVRAVEGWLHEHKEYRLDISPDPPGRDPVDVFTFERDAGFCEQIASTMALMLRASGIPTRLVAGFGPGERNLFTGYWEVRNSEAHAWVEVYYPEVGWIPYDPTFGVPSTGATNTTFVFGPLGRLALGAVPVDLFRGLAGVAGRMAVPFQAAAGVLVVAFAAGSVVLLARRRTATRGAPPDRLTAAWFRVEDALGPWGYTRPEHQTPAEFARRASRCPGLDAQTLDRFVETFTRLRYGPGPPDPGELRVCEELASEIAAGLTRERPPVFAHR